MEALWGVFAFLWSLNCSQKQTLSKWGVKMEQAVWPRAAVIWARCRNDNGLVEQYHLGPSMQGVNLLSVPIRSCCVSACTTRPGTFFFFFSTWNRVMKPLWGKSTAFNCRFHQRLIVRLRPQLAVSTGTGKTSMHFSEGAAFIHAWWFTVTWTKCNWAICTLDWYDKLLEGFEAESSTRDPAHKYQGPS